MVLEGERIYPNSYWKYVSSSYGNIDFHLDRGVVLNGVTFFDRRYYHKIQWNVQFGFKFD